MAGDAILLLDAKGNVKRELGRGVGVTALTKIGDYAAVGYRDGNIELLPLYGDAKPELAFEQAPSSPAVRMLAGPMNTLIVGYANGTFGVWNLRDGTRLGQGRLHGPVRHLLFEGGKLYVASELGSSLVWDLSVLSTGYCELLREVWGAVPVGWAEGRAVRRPPPEGHRCLR